MDNVVSENVEYGRAWSSGTSKGEPHHISIIYTRITHRDDSTYIRQNENMG
jgi:hypothetical protein